MALVDINELCQMLTQEVSTMRCTVFPSGDQIACEFDTRPGVVIHLLSPYYQNKLKKGGIPVEDVPLLIDEVKRLAERRIYSDTVIEDINSWLNRSE